MTSPLAASLQRVLITGAEGFVGRALAASLRAGVPQLHLIGTSRQPGGTACHETIVLDLVSGDIRAALAATRPEAVLHLAARSSVAQGFSAAAETFDDNLTGTVRLARALRNECPGVPIIFASSSEVYGKSFNLCCPVTEETPPAPQNAYARSKLAGEFALTDLIGASNPLVILRLFNHFGPGQDERFVIPSFAGQLRRLSGQSGDRTISVGNLEAERDFLPVSDVIAAYQAALALVTGGKPGVKLYNVASGQGRSIRSILDALIAASRLEVAVRIDPDRLRPSDIPRAVGDNARFRAETGWQSQADFQAALAAMLA